ncbi:hypothetical protein KFU94_36860 [Chloroflexi bacterium TSY]|nr:hypothetical protein [Chloroflexi bacterium TSY]
MIARSVAGIVVQATLTIFGIVLTGSGVGAVALAVLALIDALIILGCALAGDEVKPGSEVDVWVCDGITGALTEGLSYVLNDYTPLVDLEHKGRLQVAIDRPTVTQLTDNPGFVVGNELNANTTVTTTLYMGEPNWMGYIYGWQLDDDYLDNATFNYALQATKQDITPNLNGSTWTPAPGRSEEKWTNVVPDDARFVKTETVGLDYIFPAAGINQGLDAYFSEGFATEAQNCWLVPTLIGGVNPVCWLEEFDDTNYESLEDDFYFDILPST